MLIISIARYVVFILNWNIANELVVLTHTVLNKIRHLTSHLIMSKSLLVGRKRLLLFDCRQIQIPKHNIRGDFPQKCYGWKIQQNFEGCWKIFPFETGWYKVSLKNAFALEIRMVEKTNHDYIKLNGCRLISRCVCI